MVGSTAGGVLQTAQRIGSAVGQGVIGAVFFASLPHGTGHPSPASYGAALSTAVDVTLVFVAAAIALAIVDLTVTRRRVRRTPDPAPPAPVS